MEPELSIQEVAQRTGLSVHTLRYYERIGLMDPVGRASSGHRRYSENDIEWIMLLLRLRTTDMPIADMQLFADLVRQGEHTIPQRLALLEAHQYKLHRHLHAIHATLELLDGKIAHYREQTQILQQEMVVRGS